MQQPVSTRESIIVPLQAAGLSLVQPDAMQSRRLAGPWPQLNHFLEGGLPFKSLCEWGVPRGRGGREVILSFLRSPDAGPALWVHSDAGQRVYAPAWEARGIDLQRIRFATSSKPVEELKPVFMEDLFRIIILDCPPRLTPGDLAFLEQRARRQNQIIMLLQDYFLTPRLGNARTRLRLNAWQDGPSGRCTVRVIRGLSPRQMHFHPGEHR